MSDDKRKRSPNWLPSEKELLLSLVELHFKIIENKKTDGVTVKSKLAQWQIIADQYNSRTSHCSRTGDNLKAQWESMKKVARKDAATNRKHMIQTGGGSSIPPKKDDPIQQRIMSLISTSAIGLFNPYDNDSSIPAVQDQGTMVVEQTENFPAADIVNIDTAMPPTPTTFFVQEYTTETDVICENEDIVKKDWGDYTPKMLRTPVSSALKNTRTENSSPHRTWVSRRRPTHTSTSSSLEELHRKKIEALEQQTKLAVEEMERSKVRHDLDIQIKKEILKQEKIKTNILLMRRRKLAFKNRK